MTEQIKNQKNSDMTYETCPVCGQRKRRSDCLMCRDCRQEYNDENAAALAAGEQVVDLFEKAAKEGQKTLKRLLIESQKTEVLKDEKRQLLWQQASKQISINLRSQESRVSKDVRHRATVKLFRELCDQKDQDYQAISKKAYGLNKAVESLQRFIKSIEEKRQEQREKETAESPKIVRISA